MRRTGAGARVCAFAIIFEVVPGGHAAEGPPFIMRVSPSKSLRKAGTLASPQVATQSSRSGSQPKRNKAGSLAAPGLVWVDRCRFDPLAIEAT